ncbi:MAG TPA: glycosyltransferase family 2 protein [Chthoniobacterales bacterium]|jgi:GT2 family glycosyltransferase
MNDEQLYNEELSRQLATRNSELALTKMRLNEVSAKMKTVAASNQKLQAIRSRLTSERDAVLCSREYRIARFITQSLGLIFPGLRTPRIQPKSKSTPEAAPVTRPVKKAGPHPFKDYPAWRRENLPNLIVLNAMRKQVEAWQNAPTISVLLPIYNTPLDILDQAIGSVYQQAYPYWELIIANDGSGNPELATCLKEWAARDSRIRLLLMETHQGIAASYNAALLAAQGDFIALLNANDWIEPDALFEMADVACTHSEVDLIYSDEDQVNASGEFLDPFFKPDWSPDTLLSFNYIRHFCVIRRSLFERLGGFRTDFDGMQDYDFVLRATERAREIQHVSKVLYHGRISEGSAAAESAIETGRRAVEEAIVRRGIDGTVEVTSVGRYRVRYNLRETPKITILIPTKDKLDLLSRCIQSLETHTDYPNYEIVIIDNGSQEAATLAYFTTTPHRILKFEGPFNYSAICNYGVRNTTGEWLLMLNNDTEAVEAGWLTAMAEHVQRPEVGAVGARLLFPDDKVQHGGVVFAEPSVATHVYLFAHRDSFINGGQLQVIRNYSAVTAACLLIRREVFESVGGFDEVNLPVSFNDTDLCLRIRERGLRVLYTPHATLYHYESQSRGYDNQNPDENLFMRARWKPIFSHDPFHNRNIAKREYLESRPPS